MKLALVLLGADIIILCLIYVFLKRRVDRSLRSTDLLNQIETEIGLVVTELNQTTERNISLVEDRISRLTALMEQADRRMVLFQREREKESQKGPLVYTKPSPLRVTQVSLFDEPSGEASSRNEPAPAAGPREVLTVHPQGPLSTREKVVELAGQGMAPSQVATRLGVTMGEVELILSMNQRQKEKGNQE